MEVKENELVFAKMREGAIIPTKKDEDAGYDLYANFEDDYFVIEPHQTKAIPTGIACAFNKKFYAQIEERSSMAKLGIKKSGGVMDSGYRGEYLIMTYNTNHKPFIISKIPLENIPAKIKVGGKTYKTKNCIVYPYTKAVCEIVMQEVPVLETKEVSYAELKNIASLRGEGGFGSSGK
ncbi:MAG: dUTP pyrophosphatase [Clostridia bacterium]|nr:dUTP pyrophosphatase [Clostridia bacterium]